jgi:hypothetical protein
MGYELKMYVGKPGQRGAELERDKSKPFADGSGYDWKRDAQGKPVPTGRTEVYFMVYAMIELSKIGYSGDPLNRLVSEYFGKANAEAATVHYFYGADGNLAIKEDRYSAKMWPIPLAEVLEAMKASRKAEPFRRIEWAIALLEAMANDGEMAVMFFGH